MQTIYLLLRLLQSLFIILSRLDFENNVIYNPIKSTCMDVKSHDFRLKCPDVYRDNSTFEYVEKAK